VSPSTVSLRKACRTATADRFCPFTHSAAQPHKNSCAYIFAAYSQSPDAAGEIKRWVDAIQEAIDELDPEAVAARKAKEAAAAAIARKMDLTWKEEEETWDESKGRLGNSATPGHLLTPMQRRLRQQLEDGMGEGGMSFLDLVMGAKNMVGKAWAWGANGEGEAGVGTLAKGGMTAPAHIESLRRLHAPVLLAAGSMHAAALTGENELFVWGRNEEGQLAIGPKAKRSMRPYLVRQLRSSQVTHVACGNTHTLAVVTTGEAFAWGSSSTGALGIGPPTAEDEAASGGGNVVVTRHEPTKLPDVGPLYARHAALVFAGKYNSALISAEGECLVCGSNGAGQLGFGIDQLGLSVHEMRPARLEGTSEIQLVAMGDTFTAFLVDGGVLYLTGLVGKGADEFDQLRMDSAWLIDNCDAPSARSIFGEAPVVKTIAAGTEHLLVVTKYTDRDQGPIAPKATGAAASGEGGSEPVDAGMPANTDRWWHVYAMGRGYLGTDGAKEDEIASITFLRDTGCDEVTLEDGGKALQDFTGELVTNNFGWSSELVPVVGLQGQEIDEVTCGERFSIARSHDGRLYTWGDVSTPCCILPRRTRSPLCAVLHLLLCRMTMGSWVTVSSLIQTGQLKAPSLILGTNTRNKWLQDEILPSLCSSRARSG